MRKDSYLYDNNLPDFNPNFMKVISLLKQTLSIFPFSHYHFNDNNLRINQSMVF
jgi:hypothetical protein